MTLKEKPRKVQNQAASLSQERIFIKNNKQLESIIKKDILFLEAMSNYTVIHTPEKKIFNKLSLKQFEEQLASDIFFRCHRSFVINLENIDAYVPHSQEIKIGEFSIPLSRSKKAIFESNLQFL